MAPQEIAFRTAELLGVRTDLGEPISRPVGGGSICRAHRVLLPDRRTVFAKTLPGAPVGFFAAESLGLRVLESTGAVAVPEVLAVDRDLLVLEWVKPGPPSPRQAERLGRDLAALHSTRAAHFGTPYPAYVGSLPLPSPSIDQMVSSPADWPDFHVAYRLLPYLQRATDSGLIGRRDSRSVEKVCDRFAELAGSGQPPAVIHGDLWSGNVHWTPRDRPYLIDPAAQGGHPEADLAMLELFGCPHLPRLLAAYEEVRPVPGREARVALHQLHPLLVHTALFGRGYGAQAGDAARRALSGG